MLIADLKHRNLHLENNYSNLYYPELVHLLAILRERELPETVVASINKEIHELNALPDENPELNRLVKKKQTAIVKIIAAEANLVTLGHYQSQWTALGLASFGIPFGLLLGMLLKNMGMMALGLPFGLVLGSLVGKKLDRKAMEEDRQLPIQLK
mgnify:CR=1 FL=1